MTQQIPDGIKEWELLFDEFDNELEQAAPNFGHAVHLAERTLKLMARDGDSDNLALVENRVDMLIKLAFIYVRRNRPRLAKRVIERLIAQIEVGLVPRATDPQEAEYVDSIFSTVERLLLEMEMYEDAQAIVEKRDSVFAPEMWTRMISRRGLKAHAEACDHLKKLNFGANLRILLERKLRQEELEQLDALLDETC